MTNETVRRKGNFLGSTSLVITASLLTYCFLPYSTRPIFPVFVLILLVGILTSILAAAIAGVRGSRFWFLAILLPVGFFFLILNFEQPTEIEIAGKSDNATFVLSGSGTVMDFVIYNPEYPLAAETPEDSKFAMWRIEPAGHGSWGEPIWEIHSIQYGVVPKGYVQSIPLEGKPQPLRDSQRPYFLSVTTANAVGMQRYFVVEGGKPQWAKNPPDGPCFGTEHRKWRRVPCPHLAH